MKQYGNYHKHDHVSNLFTPDTPIKCEDYLKRIKELGYNCYWTTNHGTGGDIFEARDLCDKYGIKCFFGVEGYIVPNPKEKDARNYHIMILPKTNVARKKVNLITSHASEDGFYYKPRISVSDLLSLDKDDIYITTACVAGICKDEDSINQILVPLINHFKENVFLEVQNHLDQSQIEINRKCLMLSNKYGNRLIAANDSHYIYPQQSKDRLEFLKGKGINYGNEDSYILDYPDYDTLKNRFVKQGILSEKQIEEAIDNTRIFENCEEIYLDKEIKMPTIYPNLTPEQRNVELKKHINHKFAEIAKEEHITGELFEKYKEGIRYEMQIIEDTTSVKSADYFLLNEKIVDLAVNKYGGVLTRTGRGSCGSFYINRILGMTQIDRFTSPIKLYPERFISAARLLENHSMPDIDYNVNSQEPFVKASREILGEHMVYPMIAYGTMQLGEAFRNVCRSHGLEFDQFNEVAKDIESHMDDKEWKDLIEEANKYVGTIVSGSVHPCAHAMDNKDLREEYGVVRVGEFLCCMITSGEADYWKILKDDFLIVSVWDIIDKTFKLIGKPIISLKELANNLDDRVWKLYADGITCSLNQVDSDYATGLMKSYKARSVGEMAQFTAAVRPSFDAWRDGFIKRQGFTTGSEKLDEILKETEGRITFQETLMTYFQWLGVTPAESIGLIKKISKKKIHPEDFQNLENRLKENWIKQTGSIEHFAETWEMIQGCMNYSFAAPHALSVGYDSLYGAYLKVNYPLQYYTVALQSYANDMERTKKLTDELAYFNIKLSNIKFGKSKGSYSFDEKERTIYKDVSSIKYLNKEVADECYHLSQEKQYNNFIEFLKDSPLNSKQLDILIKLNYFSQFAPIGKLLNIVELYNKFGTRKTLKESDVSTLPTPVQEVIAKYTVKPKTQYKITDNDGMLRELAEMVGERPITMMMRLSWEKEFLGYCASTDQSQQGSWLVLDIDTKFSPKLSLYGVWSGEQRIVKVSKRDFQSNPLTKGDTIRLTIEQRPKTKLVDGQWVKDESVKEDWLKYYSIVK